MFLFPSILVLYLLVYQLVEFFYFYAIHGFRYYLLYVYVFFLFVSRFDCANCDSALYGVSRFCAQYGSSGGKGVDTNSSSSGAFHDSRRCFVVFVCDSYSSCVANFLNGLVAFCAFATAVLANGFTREDAFARAVYEGCRRAVSLEVRLRYCRFISVVSVRATCTREDSTYASCVYFFGASARAVFYGGCCVLLVVYGLGLSRFVVVARYSDYRSIFARVHVFFGQYFLCRTVLHDRRRVVAVFGFTRQSCYDSTFP